MQNLILSWILTLQMLLSAPLSAGEPQPRSLTRTPATQVQETRLWWGLIDPELSLWFSRVPDDESHPDQPVLWDFSWRSFLAALFGQPVIKEVVHAPQA